MAKQNQMMRFFVGLQDYLGMLANQLLLSAFFLEFEFELYPFFDKFDKKRISRTCNHIGLETKNVRECNGFPDNGIAIGTDGFGNQLILTHNGNGSLTDELYLWNHETGQIKKIAESINKLYIEKDSFWNRIKSKFNK